MCTPVSNEPQNAAMVLLCKVCLKVHTELRHFGGRSSLHVPKSSLGKVNQTKSKPKDLHEVRKTRLACKKQMEWWKAWEVIVSVIRYELSGCPKIPFTDL